MNDVTTAPAPTAKNVIVAADGFTSLAERGWM
jgi:hypothetical protein